MSDHKGGFFVCECSTTVWEVHSYLFLLSFQLFLLVYCFSKHTTKDASTFFAVFELTLIASICCLNPLSDLVQVRGELKVLRSNLRHELQ